MTIKQLSFIIFTCFFSLPAVCMVKHYNYSQYKSCLKDVSKRLAKIEERSHACLGLLRPLPPEMINSCMANLDYQSKVCLLMTCKKLYKEYINRNDVLFTLNQSDYIDAMIHFSRKNNREKVELLIQYEGPNNKKDRTDILKFLGYSETINGAIEAYKKEYPKDRVYQCSESRRLKQILTDCKVLCQVMRQQGYDLNALDAVGYTKPVYAVQDNDVDYLKLLLSLCPNVLDRNVRDAYGNTILQRIIWNEEISLNVLNVLLTDPYVDRNVKDEYGHTSLHQAVMRKKIEKIKILLNDPLIDVNIQDNDGYTALHDAAMRDKTEIVQLLLTHPKIDCNIQSSYKRVAYDYTTNPTIKAMLAPRTSFSNKHKDICHFARGCVFGAIVGFSVLAIGCLYIKQFASQETIDAIRDFLEASIEYLDTFDAKS